MPKKDATIKALKKKLKRLKAEIATLKSASGAKSKKKAMLKKASGAKKSDAEKKTPVVAKTEPMKVVAKDPMLLPTRVAAVG